MALEQIDKNNNRNISAEELHNALISWFFNKTENIDATQKQLKNYETDITKSFKEILEQQYIQINQKRIKTENENQIILLYKKLFTNNNNFLTTNNTSKPETIKPNLNWLEHNHGIEFKKLIDWVKNKYYSEYTTLIQNIQKKYAEKTPSVLQDYIKYESIIWATWKYYKELENENNQLLKKYWFYEEIEHEDQWWIKKKWEIFWWWEFYACGKLFTFLETIQYPWYKRDQELIQRYNTKSEQILKNRWYLWNNKFAEHGESYQKFEKELSQKLQESKINKSIEYLAQNPEPKDETQGSIDEYMRHTENTLLYSETYEQTTKKYGPKLLDWYIKTVQDLNTVQRDYPWLTQAMTRMADYNKKIEEKKSSLNISNETITKYIQYNQEVSQSIYVLQKRCWSLIEKVQEEIQWNTENSFIFPAVKKQIIEQQQSQEKTNKIREGIGNPDNKTAAALSFILWAGNPIFTTAIFSVSKLTKNKWIYATLSTAVGARNGLVDATIGVWIWLWVLITSIYRDEHHTHANIDKARKRTDFFKIAQSSKQLEPPVKDWQRNLNFDNGTAQLGSQVTNMLVLLSGAGMIGRWVATSWAKFGVHITQWIGRRTWLFTWASMQGLPNTFQEYLWEWLDKTTARKYALGATLLWSSLEMIAPNDMFFWNPSIKGILKQLWNKEWSKLVAKLFMKNISKEVGEEIWQESLQLAVERIINQNINLEHGTNLETSLTLADFWTTALLTALTTGIVSSKWSLQVAKNKVNKPATIAWIIEDEKRYEDYTKTLTNIINNDTQIAGIEIQKAQIILNEIINAKNMQNQIQSAHTETQTKISETEVWKNAKLNDKQRLQKAAELLGTQLTPKQDQAIIEAHNAPWTIYNIDFSQIRTRVEILSKAWFNMNQIRILMEKGICGQIEKIDFKAANYMDKGFVDEVLDGITITSFLGSLPHKFNNYSQWDLYFILTKFQEIYPDHSRKEEIKQAKENIESHTKKIAEYNSTKYLSYWKDIYDWILKPSSEVTQRRKEQLWSEYNNWVENTTLPENIRKDIEYIKRPEKTLDDIYWETETYKPRDYTNKSFPNINGLVNMGNVFDHRYGISFYTQNNKTFLENYIPESARGIQKYVDNILFKFNLEKTRLKYKILQDYHESYLADKDISSLEVDYNWLSQGYVNILRTELPMIENIYNTSRHAELIDYNQIKIMQEYDISIEILEALYAYKWTDFDDVNEFLRFNRGKKSKIIDPLLSGLNKLPNTEWTFHRHLIFDEIGYNKFLKDMIEKKESKMPWSDKGIMSVSSDKSIHQSMSSGSQNEIALVIESNTAKDINFLNLNKSEHELLIEPWIEFEVVNIGGSKHGTTTIYLRQVENTQTTDDINKEAPSTEDNSKETRETKNVNQGISNIVNNNIQLKNIIETHKLSIKWLEIFANTKYWKQYIDKIIEWWNYNILVNYKDVFTILEKNPNNIVEKIHKLWDIKINKDNIWFLIEARSENIKLLLENGILNINDINNIKNISLDIWDICSLIKHTELKESINKLWIKNLTNLIKHRHIIIDPFTTLEDKIKLLNSDKKDIIKDKQMYQNFILSSFYKLTTEEFQKYGRDKTELSRYLLEVTQLPNLWYEKNLRAYSLLTSEWSISSNPMIDYYTESYNEGWNLKYYEDRILWSRQWSQDVAQYWLRNNQTLSVYKQLTSNLSNEMIDKLPVQSWLIYRWVWKDIVELEQTIWKIEIWSIIADPAIPNFTLDMESAEWWAKWKTLFVIESKTWKLFIPNLEDHILYKKNTPMKVKNIEHNKNWVKNIIYLEEVDNRSESTTAKNNNIPKKTDTKEDKKSNEKSKEQKTKETINLAKKQLQVPIKNWKVEYTKQGQIILDAINNREILKRKGNKTTI